MITLEATKGGTIQNQGISFLGTRNSATGTSHQERVETTQAILYSAHDDPYKQHRGYFGY